MTFTWKEFPIIFITDSGTYDKASFDNVFEKGWTNYMTACEKPTLIVICRVFFWNKPVPAKVTVLLSAEWSMCSRGVLPRPWFMLKRSLGGWVGKEGHSREAELSQLSTGWSDVVLRISAAPLPRGRSRHTLLLPGRSLSVFLDFLLSGLLYIFVTFIEDLKALLFTLVYFDSMGYILYTDVYHIRN